jgi:hypothetical protein
MHLLLANPQVDVVFGNFLNINLATGENGFGFNQNRYSMSLLENENISADAFLITGNFFESIGISNFIAFDTVVIRRDFADKVGDFNENLRNSMDYEYWWRSALVGGRLAYINTVVLTRIKPPGSLSSSGILTYENKIKGLDFCLQASLAADRKDLVHYLDRPYAGAWQNLIRLYGSSGDRQATLKAFFQSMRYGFNLSSIRLLFESIHMSKVVED